MRLPYIRLIIMLSLPPAALPAKTETATLKLADGTELGYAVSVPRSIEPGKPAPLVLALHYGWAGARPPAGYGAEFLRLLVEPGLERLNAILVAPDCPSRSWTESKSEAAVLELVEHLASAHAVDRGRIVVTGFSLGGFGTWYLAATHPDVFCAAIPIAGRPQPEWIEEIGSIPLFVIHSRKDEIVPIAPTEEAVRTLRRRGAIVEFKVIDGLGHYQTGDFVPYLRSAASWLNRLWEKARE